MRPLLCVIALVIASNCSTPVTSSEAADAGTEVGVDASTPAGTDGGTVQPTTCDFHDADRTVGLKRCQSDRLGGFLLYPAKHTGDVYLIDRMGRVVNHWAKSAQEPGQSCYLRPNGNLVRAGLLKGAGSIGGGEGGRIQEYDWDDNLVWQFDYASNDHMTHHDFKIVPNGNLLMLAVERKTSSEAVAAGFDGAKLQDGYVAPDMVIEVQKTGATSFQIVWEWHVWDHLCQSRNPALANYAAARDCPGRLHVDGGAPAFWNHANSIDYNPDLDQIVISARTHNEVWVIDHSTTTAEAKTSSGGTRGKGGDFLYRWGNPQNHGAGGAADRMLFNQHDAQWIAPGLPGAGNLLVFNNGLDRPAGLYSSADEFTTPVQADGSYASPAAGVAFGPRTLTWQFVGNPPTSFYSAEISGVQRLPTGNTLICEGLTGRFFEVTRAGEIVWEYVNPVRTNGPMAQYELAPLDVKEHPENAVFKGHWYPADFSGFAGRDLTPGDVIEKSETACPAANDNYRCTTTADCSSKGGEDVTTHFSCASGSICCFKLTKSTLPPPGK